MNDNDRLNLLKEILDKTTNFCVYVYKAINAEITSSAIYPMKEIECVGESFNVLTNSVKELINECIKIKNQEMFSNDDFQKGKMGIGSMNKEFEEIYKVVMNKIEDLCEELKMLHQSIKQVDEDHKWQGGGVIHTPETWTFDNELSRVIVILAPDGDIVSVCGCESGDYINPIATTPEMLDALKRTDKFFKNTTFEISYIQTPESLDPAFDAPMFIKNTIKKMRD